MSYPKTWKSLAEQIALLKSRGLAISDDTKAAEYLERIGYYRLSGYFYAMRELSGEYSELQNFQKPQKLKVKKMVMDDFKRGASFENAVALYIFDKQLRLLATDALERIEISVRVDIAYALGKLNKFAYLKPACLHEKFCSELDKKNRTKPASHLAWQACPINQPFKRRICQTQ
ncbi:Abi family protein [Uruburuella testudinis]|uniref:Abi family protein n=1 Tax=Uruburuella testudinis TaxID=1282863 RepID=A0ABY4DS89_9NEIS|nr:Abi family protein [Uruburuella testudinis]UOO81902.1 Abi family protein [Uruburuella testudinis]